MKPPAGLHEFYPSVRVLDLITAVDKVYHSGFYMSPSQPTDGLLIRIFSFFCERYVLKMGMYRSQKNEIGNETLMVVLSVNTISSLMKLKVLSPFCRIFLKARLLL